MKGMVVAKVAGDVRLLSLSLALVIFISTNERSYPSVWSVPKLTDFNAWCGVHGRKIDGKGEIWGERDGSIREGPLGYSLS